MTRYYHWNDELEVIPGSEEEPMRLGEKLLLSPELNLGASKVISPSEPQKKTPVKKSTSDGAKYIPWYDRLPEKKKPNEIQKLTEDLQKVKKTNEVLMKYGKPDEKFLQDLEPVKFEEGIGYVGQMSGNKIDDVKKAVKMNDFVETTTDEDWRTLKHIQKTNYETGLIPKPYWMKKEEQQKSDTRTPVQKKRDEWKQKKTVTQLKNLKKWAQGDSEEEVLPRNMPRDPKTYSKGGMVKIFQTPIGTVKDLSNTKAKDNSWEDLKDGKITRVYKEKGPDNWTVIKKSATSPEEIKSIRETVQHHVKSMGTTEFLEPDEYKYLEVNGQIPGTPEDKPEVSQNTQMLNDMELLAKQDLQGQRLERKFHEIMKPQRDPDLDKGIASVVDVSKFKKVVDLAEDKFKRTNYGLNTILGEPK